MFGVWLHNINNRFRVIPTNQPVIAEGKLKIGNGVDVWDDLLEVGRTPNIFESTSINVADPGLYGEAYLETHVASSTTDNIEWGTEDAGVYNSDVPVVDLTDDGNLRILRDGLYELLITTYGYGNGATGAHYAQTDVLQVLEPYDLPLGLAYVSLSGVTGQLLSNDNQPTRRMVALKKDAVIRAQYAAIWPSGAIPSGTNFECDIMLVPLLISND